MKRIALLAALGALLAADAFLLVGVARRGAPETVLRLTADEVFVPPRNEENAPLVLRLNWRRPEMPPPPEFAGSSSRLDAVPAFAVLELRPAAEAGKTRLQAIDVGSDPGRLRAGYPDRGRYAIAQAVVRPLWKGWLSLTPEDIYVPAEYLPALRKPGYELSLCYGARGEVWVCGATR